MPQDTPAAFEEQIARLQEISARLEQGGLSLEDSLTLYKEGVALTAGCRKLLENARHTVRIYTENGLEDFEQGSGSADPDEPADPDDPDYKDGGDDL